MFLGQIDDGGRNGCDTRSTKSLIILALACLVEHLRMKAFVGDCDPGEESGGVWFTGISAASGAAVCGEAQVINSTGHIWLLP